MKETLEIILVAIAGAVVLIAAGVLVCALFGWIDVGLLALSGSALSWGRGSWRSDSLQRAADRRMARLRSPQFGVLEAHFGAPVPEGLKRLYRNTELLAQQDFRLIDAEDSDPEGGDFISEFLPADKTALDEIGGEFGEPLFPFASDGFGNYYCVLIRGEAPDPCPVYFWFHEAPATLEEMRIADSLDEFAARPRAPGAGADA